MADTDEKPKKPGRPRKYPEGYRAYHAKQPKPPKDPFYSGRPKGKVNSPEVRARIGKTHHENAWRRKGGQSPSEMQSSSGYAGEQDYSVACGECRHVAKLWEERGNNWWSYND